MGAWVDKVVKPAHVRVALDTRRAGTGETGTLHDPWSADKGTPKFNHRYPSPTNHYLLSDIASAPFSNMPYFDTSQQWLEQSSLLLKARPTTVCTSNEPGAGH